jgi:hypothetical protein
LRSAHYAAGSINEGFEDLGAIAPTDEATSSSSPYASSPPSSPSLPSSPFAALLAMITWRMSESAYANRKHFIPITTGRTKKHFSALTKRVREARRRCDAVIGARRLRASARSMQQHAQIVHRNARIEKTRAASTLLRCQLRDVRRVATRLNARVVGKIHTQSVRLCQKETCE